MSKMLEGKVVLITGCASGIGRATALLCAQEGASVALADRDEGGGRATEREIGAHGGRGRFFTCDVTNEDSVSKAVKATIENFGRLDGAFNNAGIAGDDGAAPARKSADLEHAAWANILDVNLTGVWRCMKHEIREMTGGGSGAIVNTASIAGLVGIGGQAAYVASKHGVVGLTKTAAIEYSAKGIRINAICPGFVVTPMTESALARAGDALLARIPARRYGLAEEIAQAAVWLLSDRASFVTGCAVAIDGGFTAQ